MSYRENALIIKTSCLAEGIYEMWLKTDKMAGEAVPGQFTKVKLLLDVRENATVVPQKSLIIEKGKITSCHPYRPYPEQPSAFQVFLLSFLR